MSIEKRTIDCPRCGEVTFTVLMRNHEADEAPLSSTFDRVLDYGLCKVAAAAPGGRPVASEAKECPYLANPS
jgi:hypothetical protein